jgi:Ca2+-binding EF-hand superfamily protein
MNTQSLVLLVLSAIILPTTNQAKPNHTQCEGNKRKQPPSIEEVLAHLDADDSGGISLDEAKGPLAQDFDRIDLDGSGEITRAELKASRDNRLGRGMEMREKIQAADTDGNGAISNAEASEAGLDKLIEHFDKIDTDGNDEVTERELEAAGKRIRK